MVLGETDFIVEGVFFVGEDEKVFFLFLFGACVSLCFVLGDVEGLTVPGLPIER